MSRERERPITILFYDWMQPIIEAIKQNLPIDQQIAAHHKEAKQISNSCYMWWRETESSIFDDDFSSFGDVDSEDEVDELDS